MQNSESRIQNKEAGTAAERLNWGERQVKRFSAAEMVAGVGMMFVPTLGTVGAITLAAGFIKWNYLNDKETATK